MAATEAATEAPTLAAPAQTRAVGSESPTRRALRRLVRHRLAMVGLVVIVVMIILAILGNEYLAYNQNLRLGYTNRPPDGQFLLGTDALGRDVLSRLLVGGRISILVALVSVAIATTIGTTVGVVSGYFGGAADQLLMRFVDIILSFPIILLLIVAAAIVGPGAATLVVIIGLVTWAPASRIVRGQLLSLREATFVEAARVIGVSDWTMIRSHILPNIVAPLVVFATFNVASVIIFEASLSYLGIGVQPPEPAGATCSTWRARSPSCNAILAVGPTGDLHRADGAVSQLRRRRAARRFRPTRDVAALSPASRTRPRGVRSTCHEPASLDGPMNDAPASPARTAPAARATRRRPHVGGSAAPSRGRVAGSWVSRLQPVYALYADRLRAEVLGSPRPRHVALIMDGNRRWAIREGFQDHRVGHRRGAEKALELIDWCADLGIREVTLWALSVENLGRSRGGNRHDHRRRRRCPVLTRRRPPAHARARPSPRHRPARAPAGTAPARRGGIGGRFPGPDGAMDVTIALAYSGRDELLRGVPGDPARPRRRGRAGRRSGGAGHGRRLAANLYTSGSSDPDLIVRTSGEVRLSGFLPWQSVYSEYYFCDAYWPAFRDRFPAGDPDIPGSEPPLRALIQGVFSVRRRPRGHR